MSQKEKPLKQPSFKEQLASQRRINANISGEELPEDEVDEDEEEEEDTSASSLTVAELKVALDDAEIEYPKDAKKADLVALYEANSLGDAQ